MREGEKEEASYGVISYGRGNGAAGWSYSQSSENDARRVALRNCARYASDCEIVISFSNSCAAIAAGADGVVTKGQADSSDDAEEKAMAACAKEAGDSCEIQAWSCSRP